MRLVLVLVLVLGSLAGCLAADDVDPATLPTPDLATLLPHLDLSEEHDHHDHDGHRAGWNLDLAAWTHYADDVADPGRANQVQVKGDLAFVSVYGVPPNRKPGLVVVDLAAEGGPKPIGRFASEFTTTIDVHLSEDGTFAALAGHRHDAGSDAPSAVPCTAAPVPGRPVTVCQPYLPAGIQLVDVADPAKPTLACAYTSLPTGAHTVKLATIDGDLYAFIASYGFSWLDRLASGVEIVRYDPASDRCFEPVSRFLAEEPSGGRSDGRVFVHDMYVQVHPATGERLLYVAYWDGGVVIANVDDPANPREIAAWNEFDAGTYGNIHFVQPMPALVDGRHYTVAAPEFGSAEHAGETYVLDTTDPTQPQLLARWQLPGNPVSPSDYMHSPHNFDLTPEGRMVLAHYHAGVWALDLRPVFAGADEPLVLGYRFTPAPEGLDIAIPDDGFATDVWNAVWLGDGRILASDQYTGLHVLALASDAPGAPPYDGLV